MLGCTGKRHVPGNIPGTSGMKTVFGFEWGRDQCPSENHKTWGTGRRNVKKP